MIRRIADQGSAVLLVEQSVNVALSVADHAYVMEKGEIGYSGPGRCSCGPGPTCCGPPTSKAWPWPCVTTAISLVIPRPERCGLGDPLSEMGCGDGVF